VAAGASVLVTAVAVLGGLGVGSFAPEPAGARSVPADEAGVQGSAAASVGDRVVVIDEPVPNRSARAPEHHLPSGSGSGRRIVFSEGLQRVWLVGAGDVVRRTYRVSGSAEDNLDPGTYAVFSRSEWATGIDDSGTMRWFVRFTEGENAAIGFHSIPELQGEPVQTVAQLGTPLSHGCIRQRLVDAKALWDFAPVGTKVVVTA
jgi:hypothetical protein